MGRIRQLPSDLEVALAMLFRLAALLFVALLIQRNGVRGEIQGHRPILLSEVRAFLPAAHRFRVDGSEAGRLRVLDAENRSIGFALRTMPRSRQIRGYSGPSDVLLVLDEAEKLAGIAIRHSYDTPSHVADVARDYLFMEQWDGQTLEEIAAGLEGETSDFHLVSGATRTSEAMVQSLILRAGAKDEGEAGAPALRLRWHDAALAALAIAAILLSLVRRPLVQRSRSLVHVAMVVYLGIVSGDLLAQSLLVSWTVHGIPWGQLPGLVLLAAVAFLLPWSTGKPVYCTHICPHGHLQRWMMRLLPARRKVHLGREERWSFGLLPGILLCTMLVVVFLGLPFDLADFEPFDAWLLTAAGIGSIAVALVSLVFSFFVPMGYCRYGCPTGFLLELARREKGGFRKKDLWLATLCVLAGGLYLGGPAFEAWLSL